MNWLKKNYQVLLAVIVLAALAVAVVYYVSTMSVQDLYNWYRDHMGYGTITLLMAIESSIIPLPSEVVVPPAAYFALQPGSELDLLWVIVTATVGAVLGAVINYGLSMLIGRPVIYAFADSRWGRMLMLSGEKLDHAEAYFRRKGSLSIFLGRLLPAVRHLISIPAGLSRMHLGKFTLYTTLGATLWNVCLAAMGYLLYLAVPDPTSLFERMQEYNHVVKLAGYSILALLVAYIAYKYYHNRKPSTSSQQ